MLDDLVQLAKLQPHRVHEAITEAYRRGRGLRSEPAISVAQERRELVRKLRRRASVTSEHDGRSHLLELAGELEALEGK